MNDSMLDNIKEQHRISYKSSIKEIIKNNTTSLVDEDIMFLFRNPPLDSMDIIKCKFLDIAKSNNVILNSDVLNNALDAYRKRLKKECNILKQERINYLSDIVDEFDLKKDADIIKINKKNLNVINKMIKTAIKDVLVISYEKTINKNFDKIIHCTIDEDLKNKIYNDINKYIKNNYNKQIIESINMKIMVKDNILLNSIKEHSERYLFTINNSRLLNDNLKKDID